MHQLDEAGQHGGGDLARVRTLRFGMDILGADGDIGAGQGIADDGERDDGRADDAA